MKAIAKTATLTLQTRDQNVESINRMMARILSLAGCGKCGRLALVNVKFLGDPPPELGRDGVISIEAQGF